MEAGWDWLYGRLGSGGGHAGHVEGACWLAMWCGQARHVMEADWNWGHVAMQRKNIGHGHWTGSAFDGGRLGLWVVVGWAVIMRWRQAGSVEGACWAMACGAGRFDRRWRHPGNVVEHARHMVEAGWDWGGGGMGALNMGEAS